MHPSRSFVLRCLSVPVGAGAARGWRFTLQEAVPDAPRHAFADVDALAAFLRAEMHSPRTTPRWDDGP